MEISPKALEFSSPFTYQSQTSITLHNNTSDRYAFKVKTTAPRRYFVRPNAAVVEPGETQSITVILQPYDEEPSENYKCSDKFLLMQCVAPAHIESSNFADFWSSQERSNSGALTNKKLRVQYHVASAEELPALLAQAAAGGHTQHAHATEASVNAAAAAAHQNATPAYSILDDDSALGHNPASPSSTEDVSLQEALSNADSNIRSVSEEIGADRSAAFEAPVKSRADNSSASAPAKSSGSSVLQKKILVNSKDISLPQALALALVAFLIGWYFF